MMRIHSRLRKRVIRMIGAVRTHTQVLFFNQFLVRLYCKWCDFIHALLCLVPFGPEGKAPNERHGIT